MISPANIEYHREKRDTDRFTIAAKLFLLSAMSPLAVTFSTHG